MYFNNHKRFLFYFKDSTQSSVTRTLSVWDLKGASNDGNDSENSINTGSVRH